MSTLKKKILIIDDEPHLVVIIKDRLNANNFDVITAAGGEEGLRKAEENPDLILLDIMMPEIDGYAVLKKLKAEDRTKNIPVIMLTAKGDPQAVESASDLGALDYLVKPVSPSILLNKVRKALK